MKLRCLLMGCRWETGVECMLGDERVRWQICKCCGAHRYVAAGEGAR